MEFFPAIREIAAPKTLGFILISEYRRYGCPRCNFDQLAVGVDKEDQKVGTCGDCGTFFGVIDDGYVPSYPGYACLIVKHMSPINKHHILGAYLKQAWYQEKLREENAMATNTQSEERDEDDLPMAIILGDEPDAQPRELVAIAVKVSSFDSGYMTRTARMMRTGLAPTQVPMSHGACRNGITPSGDHCPCVFD